MLVADAEDSQLGSESGSESPFPEPGLCTAAEHQACAHRPLCTTGVLTPVAHARSFHELAF